MKTIVDYATLEKGYVDEALTNEVEARATLGAHNLLPNNATTQVVNDVTFTVNSNGTVLVNGTNSVANPWVTSISANVLLKKGSYILSGTPEGAYSIGNGCFIALINSSTLAGIATDYGSGAEFTLSEDTTITTRFYVTASATISNKTFKPMIRLASDTDTTYQPYAMTNQELTENKAEQSAIGDTYNSSTTYAVGDVFQYNGVTYTVITACTGVTPPNATYYTAGSISSLISDLANSSSTTTTVTLGDLSTSMTLYKKGNIVSFGLYLGNNTLFSDFSGSVSIGTLPSGYYPKIQAIAVGVARTQATWAGASYYPIIIQLGTDGSIELKGTASDMQTCRYLTICGTYICAD